MGEVNRPLSAVERWYWFADQFSTLNVIARVKVRGELDLDALRRGLDKLQARHPLLRTRIEHEDGGIDPRWVVCERPIPLRQVERGARDQWIKEINERELIDRVDTDTGPLIRAVAITGTDGAHDLLVVVPHIIADGTTILSLAEQWLALAADRDPQQWTARVLAPAEDMRLPRYLGEEGAARLAEQMAADEALVAECRPGRVEPDRAVPFQERRTRLIHRELTNDQVAAIAKAAREHDTTVHGALTAALVLAAARDAGKGSTHFAVGSPVNLRDELEPSVRPDEVGAYVATIPTILDVSVPFWKVAHNVTTDLTRRRDRGDHFNLMEMIVSAIPGSMAEARPFMELMERDGPINLCSSNIGRHAFPIRFGALEASDAQFVAGISVLGYFVATINSSHGRLFWNFTHIDGALSRSRAERLADACVDAVLSATGQSAPMEAEGAVA